MNKEINISAHTQHPLAHFSIMTMWSVISLDIFFMLLGSSIFSQTIRGPSLWSWTTWFSWPYFLTTHKEDEGLIKVPVESKHPCALTAQPWQGLSLACYTYLLNTHVQRMRSVQPLKSTCRGQVTLILHWAWPTMLWVDKRDPWPQRLVSDMAAGVTRE